MSIRPAWISTVALASLGLAAVLAPSGSVAAPSAPAAATSVRCTAAVARAPAAQYCVHYAAGYVQFRTSMSPPSNVFTIEGKGVQVVGFPDWIIIVKSNGEQIVVPRDRFIYSAEARFPDD